MFLLSGKNTKRYNSNFMTTLRPLFSGLLRRQTGGILFFVLVFIGLAQGLRIALIYKASANVTWDASLLAALSWGLLFDFGTAAFFSIPLTLLLTVLPNRWFAKPWMEMVMNLGCFLILFVLFFGVLSEWIFWDEFEARFNFIAVDYLVYTTEVIGNIRESYPLPQLIIALFAVTLVVHLAIFGTGLPRLWFQSAAEPLKQRVTFGAAWLTITLLIGLSLNERILPEFTNNFHREIAKNGIWSLVAAFRNNELDYRQFYSTIESEKAFALLHRELSQD